MTPTVVVILVAGIVAFDLVIVFLVIRTIGKSTISALAATYPAVEPLPGAVRRNFQSFSFGVMNLGLCVHVAVDDRHLHLIPAAIIRWCGCRPASVPWEAITVVRRRGKRWLDVRVGHVAFSGPAWCLGLAGDAPPPPGR